MPSVKPDTEPNVTNREIMTRAKINSGTLNLLSHPGTPKLVVF